MRRLFAAMTMLIGVEASAQPPPSINYGPYCSAMRFYNSGLYASMRMGSAASQSKMVAQPRQQRRLRPLDRMSFSIHEPTQHQVHKLETGGAK